MVNMWFYGLKRFFINAPLIPVICQDERNGEVLMLGYADEEALRTYRKNLQHL